MTTQTEHPTTTARDNVKLTRWVATIAGLIGFVLSVATPLLPVVQTTANLNWPQQGQLKSVTAPLISLTPVDFHATVPCEVVRDMPPTGGVVLGIFMYVPIYWIHQPFYEPVIGFTILVLVLMVRPTGLFGESLGRAA